ncbi:MAG: ABC transporter ATP-binding protein [Vicinamibacteria bacterium]|nr:ABC transporter ATP-binding protein [Vicinamibacteria bacterium]
MATESAISGGPIVFVEDLSKRFGAEWALARANFSVEQGRLALLTGANGSGKTTLLRCLSTALVPDFGRASIGGIDLISGRDTVRGRVAALNQPPGFYGGLSARENLTLTNAVLGLAREDALDAVLDRVGLGSKQKMPLDAFSSGMKQRFALARLSLLQRDVVLLDEPETHLDAAGLILLQELISEWKARGAAIICATHAHERFQGLFDLEVRLVGGRPENPGGTH